MSIREVTPNFKFFALITLFLVTVDIYVALAIRKSVEKFKYRNWVKLLYLIAVVTAYIGFYFLSYNFMEKPLESYAYQNLFIGFFFTFLITKLFLIIFFLAEDIYRIFHLIYLTFKKLFIKPGHRFKAPGRRRFIRQAGLTLAAIPFTSLLYGITKGKYNFKIRELQLALKNLPKAFNGFKIVQISDIHLGSFDSIEAVEEAVKMINAQHADVILFTGDLVNNDSREVIPFISEFKKLKAARGVYSVLGNHDYGDYKHWDSEEEKEANNRLLFKFQKEMNFILLRNEHVVFEKNGDKIGLYGVENWGHKPFPQRADLDRSLQGAEEIPFKLLMTHDPTHWTRKVISHPTHFDLTFSGHTHGMQMGVEIPGFKWSPIEYLYPQWAGLYQDAGQYLYVNRGFGFVGFPGRAGIWPEITVIELKTKNA